MTKILLVEDDKSLREIYGVRLLAEGYDIVSAGDGEEALAMAIKDRPALIVSDVMMPKISGFDMLDILRSTTETRDIKVIMMTALSSEDQRKRGEQLGADRYLVKSQVGIEDVVRTVHEVLADSPAIASNDFSRSATPAPQPAPAAPAAQMQSPVNRPAAPVVPPRDATQPAATATPPQAPQPQAQPAAAPAPQPAPSPVAPTPVVSTPPVAQSQPTPNPLPQPTAPFSTPRPSNASNRVIEPITQPTSAGAPVADLLQKELEQLSVAPQTPAPVAVPAPQPIQVTSPQPPQPVAAPAPTSIGIEYEETPQRSPEEPAA